MLSFLEVDDIGNRHLLEFWPSHLDTMVMDSNLVTSWKPRCSARGRERAEARARIEEWLRKAKR